MNEVNTIRYNSNGLNGHYESYFVRANHPIEKKAFWIRYTIFSPKGDATKAIAELWVIWFDGITQKHVAVKKEIPFSKAHFSTDELNVSIDDSILTETALSGVVETASGKIKWNLNYSGGEKPLLVLPENLYQTPLPKAKLLVGKPLAVFTGTVAVNNEVFEINNWVGSQNHNWGVKHTDHYAWGQVAGFDNSPESFLEVATARLKFGPIWTPFMTVMVLRHKGQEFKLNGISHALKAKADFNYFNWHFNSSTKDVEITGWIKANENDFVGLKYYNPPGGIKNCLNSKIASCNIKVKFKNSDGKIIEDVLTTSSRAAFEILTDDTNHGIPLVV